MDEQAVGELAEYLFEVQFLGFFAPLEDSAR
jgi:hypothetical protein